MSTSNGTGNEIDFLAIGDITTDAFIHLEDAKELMDHGERELCVRFGDKVPYESVTIIPGVGNSPNAAVSASRLGLRSAVVVNIGDDENGIECIEAMTKDKVMTDFVRVQKGKKTNYHYVLWYEDERTILIKHEAYEYKLPEIGSPKWIYLSSLGENTVTFQHEIASYVTAHPEIKLAFQPGTFQIKSTKELADLYVASDIFFCNVEEARRILDNNETDIKKQLESVHALGPKIVVITDGPKGAYAWQDGEAWFMPTYPDPKPPLQRTGAGDAFASTFTSALAMGKTIPEALAMAPINSMSVVQQIGAQRGLLSLAEIEGHLAKAPADYVAKKL